MEKLLTLLNEYDSSRIYKRDKDKGWRLGRYGELLHGDTWLVNAKLQCISKSYGFIKRLVENDKIERDNVGYSLLIACLNTYHGFDEEEQLLMILSIQDNPLEYLCSILK